MTLGPVAPFRPGQLWWAVPDERSLGVGAVDFMGVHQQTLLGIEAFPNTVVEWNKTRSS